MSTTRSYKARKAFLDALEKSSSPSKAAKIAGKTLSFFKDWAKDDPDFKADWEEAEETGTDDLEDVAVKRAKRDSDGLLTFLLKARRPEKYRERTSVEHSGSVDLSGAREKLSAKLAALASRQGQGGAASKSE